MNIGRSPFQYLKRQLDATDVRLDDQVRHTIEFCVAVRTNTSIGTRERLRATELLESIRARGIDIAKYLDERERTDGGQATQRIEIVFADPLPRRDVDALED